MDITQLIKERVSESIQSIWDKQVSPEELQLQETRKEFDGDFTLITFPLTKYKLGNPAEVAQKIGDFLVKTSDYIAGFEVVKGFLNLMVEEQYWIGFVKDFDPEVKLRNRIGSGRKVMVEFSSPNTNKPLHLGHLRNNFLGDSVCRILDANGYEVIRTCLVNDRGIAICKSMLAYRKWGKGETPRSAGLKPDHFVVKWYVMFDEKNKAEAAEMTDKSGKEAEMNTPLMQEARAMLQRWEAGDMEVMALWEKMNGWVYEGFDATYDRIGVHFDKVYYESRTYLLGKDIIEEGLQNGVFYKRDDGSVWIDLTSDGLDEKLVLRSDGTSVYMTQDMGTIESRFKEYSMDKMVYVVGNEQDYHFKVLFLIMKKLGRKWADELHHLSYGMVNLPTGKMKSREGTVVDADDLIDEVVGHARDITAEKGKTDGMAGDEIDQLSEMLGLGALKYYLLRVDPKKSMMFDPKESVSLEGDTGPFLQYVSVRVKGIYRNAGAHGGTGFDPSAISLNKEERTLVRSVYRFREVLAEAGENYDPSILVNYLFALAKDFNRFYHDHRVVNADDPEVSKFRLALTGMIGETFGRGLGMLGMQVPERM